MNAKLEHDDCECCPEGTTTLTMVCEREDAALVYFALRDYADHLQKSLKKSKTQDFEDRAFLHEQLGKINAFIFQMLDDHPQAVADEIHRWLDVI